MGGIVIRNYFAVFSLINIEFSQHVNQSRFILCQEVKELCSLYIYIYIFV